MDDSTTRVVIIATNILVTMAIVTLVVFSFSQMKEIYGIVNKTDNSIYNKFNDIYSMYNGRVESGIGLLNTLKKYEEAQDEQIVIMYPNATEIRAEIKGLNETRVRYDQIREANYLKDLMKNNSTYNGITYKYENKYNVTVINGINGKIVINYEKIT